MTDQHISQVRAFNRFYTVFMGILDKSYLKSPYSLAETRILHAAYTRPGITPTEIVASLNIDKSYLSRMVLRLEKEKLINKKRAKKDGRAINIFITAAGKTQLNQLNKASDREIGAMLKKLSDKDCKQLVKNMSDIESILSGIE